MLLINRKGYSYEKLYGVWKGMRQRCNCSTNRQYKNYGGRGIKVCDEWNKSYLEFRAWALTNGYKRGLTIDRTNNNGNYEPNNCRWITSKQQQFNKRNNRLVTINGITKTATQWALDNNLNQKTLDHRLRLGWTGGKLISPIKSGIRTNNKMVTYNGETLPLFQWSKKLNIDYSLLHTRIKRGWKVEELFKPKGYKREKRKMRTAHCIFCGQLTRNRYNQKPLCLDCINNIAETSKVI